MKNVKFLVIGHITHDVKETEIYPGGSALFAGYLAKKFGEKVGMITSFGKNFKFFNLLQDFKVSYKLSKCTTTFRNIYIKGKRVQFIDAVAEKIDNKLIYPNFKKTPVVLLCPVAQEFSLSLIEIFQNSLIGVTPQGFMRSWNKSMKVERKRWLPKKNYLNKIDVLILSEEDLGENKGDLKYYVDNVNVVILTQGRRGSILYYKNKKYKIFPYPTKNEVDLTGAGDVFAASFMIRFYQTKDAIDSARFASCAASFSIEDYGLNKVPDYYQVIERYKEYLSIYYEKEEVKLKAI